MTTDVIDEYTLLHVLKVKGFASVESVALSTGASTDALQEALQRAVADESAKYREGRLTGYTLTAAGRARHLDLRSASVSPQAAEKLAEAYEAFLAPNRAFKQLTTDWQLRAEGAETAPLLALLDDVNASVTTVIETATEADPRFARYGTRFTAALDRLIAGDETAFAKPMSDSYHDVWMELHEDLLDSLGRERTDADE